MIFLLYVAAILVVLGIFQTARKSRRGGRVVAAVAMSAVLLLSAGCISEAVLKAYRRGELVLKDRGEKGDAVAAAAGKEMEEANKSTGADQIPVEAVPLTVEAAAENAVEIVKDREAAQAIKDFFKKIGESLGGLGEKLPYIGPMIGMGLGLIEMVRRLWKKKRAVAGGLNSIQALKDAARDSGKGLSLRRIKTILTTVRTEGPKLVAGAKELKAEYDGWKKARDKEAVKAEDEEA